MNPLKILLVVLILVHVNVIGNTSPALLIPTESQASLSIQIGMSEGYMFLSDSSNITPSLSWEANLSGSFLCATMLNDGEVLIIHSVSNSISYLTILDVDTGQTKNTKLLYGVKRVVMSTTINNSILIVHDSGIMRLYGQNLTEIWNITTPAILSAILIPNYYGEYAVAVACVDNVFIYAVSNGSKLETYNITGEPIAMALGQKSEAIYILTKQNTQVLWVNGTSRVLQTQQSDFGRIIICDLNHDDLDDLIIIRWNESAWKYSITIIVNGHVQKIIESSADHLHLPFHREPIVFLDDIDADFNIDIVYENVTYQPPYTIYYVRYVNILRYDIARNRSSRLFTTYWYRPSKVATVDLDGDHRRDIILCTEGYQATDVVEIAQRIEFYTYSGQAIAYVNVPGYPKERIIIEESGAIIYCGQIYTQDEPCIVVQRIDLGVSIHNTYWGKQLLTSNLAEVDTDKDLLSDQCEIKLWLNPEDQDTDNDTLPDGWEYMNNLDPLDPTDAAQDNDRDGLDNKMEYTYGGDPWKTDTDNDGLDDHDEVQYGTDPRLSDTDGDGMPDLWELEYDFDPTDATDGALDADNDGLSNLGEYQSSTNPLNPDTDGDGMSDGWEVTYGLDPLHDNSSLDTDGDGLSNIDEYHYGTDPLRNDTDGDGMLDSWEVACGLDPLHDDSSLDPDGDGLSNIDEYHYGTDPRNPDTDGDGYCDGCEVSRGTDPLDPDDYPAPLIVRYWWVPVACVAVIVVFVVFFYRRGVLVGRHDRRL